MKKIVSFVFLLVFALSLVGCGGAKEVAIDYPDVAAFESALNDGEDLSGKTVTITVDTLVPNSAFGYNIQTGEHLNFCSEKNPGVSEGDTLNVKVVEVASMLGSFIITYEILK